MKNSFIIFLGVIFAVNCQMITKTGDVLIKPVKPTVSNKLMIGVFVNLRNNIGQSKFNR
jgi:hypothetical protein